MDPILPPGVTAAAMDRALKAFARIVGSENVFATAEDRDTYVDKFAVDDAKHHPYGAVAPISTEEVRAIVKVAAENRIPIWPISRGKNLGYGGSAPNWPGRSSSICRG
jgi:4-cresol dehydrogenase (hydroxylating)